jgi:hypothetical protein
MQTVSLETIRFINQAIERLDSMNALKRSFHHHFFYPWGRRDDVQNSLSECRDIILELEGMTPEPEQDLDNMPISECLDGRYPIYHDTVDVVHIYEDGISLECHRPLVEPKQIPKLLFLLRIPRCPEGVEVENHGFGYHFHYGKVKSEAIVRTNLLLTFNPQRHLVNETEKKLTQQPSLYGEQHAEGKTKKINMDLIGNNKRLPIYLVCLEAGKKRRFSDFKPPGAKAKVFHSTEVAV